MEPASLLEQLPDAVVAADRAGVIRVWNAAASQLFGYAPAEAIGQTLDLIIPERLRDAHWKGYHAALAAGQTKYAGRVMTTRATPKNGEKLYVGMCFAIVRDPSGQACGAVASARRVERP
ncbi:MAG: PAS domain-containing protein [Burkholderiaceae bacterium]|nr:PAS domain-containing protein [Burkholderiaceae bacterium]